MIFRFRTSTNLNNSQQFSTFLNTSGCISNDAPFALRRIRVVHADLRREHARSHSGFTPAAFTIGNHFSISVL